MWLASAHPEPACSGSVVSASAQPDGNLLEVRNLTVQFGSQGNEFTVLHQVDLSLAPGECVGLLGESGSGKTTLALSLLQLLPPNARIASGSIGFRGQNLLSLEERHLRQIRGAEISLIYQDPSVLNPVLPIGKQVAEVIGAHMNWDSGRRREAVRTALASVGLGGTRYYQAYPHQLSGGQRQRVAIAQAIACDPRLLIADEPTAWLDPETSAEILDLLRTLRKRCLTSVLLITHDPEILADFADRTLVMYAGEIVEDAPTRQLLSEPLHPYTAALLQCGKRVRREHMSQHGRGPVLACISGTSPHPVRVPSGCQFFPRCESQMDICRCNRPDAVAVGPGRTVRCFKHGAPV